MKELITYILSAIILIGMFSSGFLVSHTFFEQEVEVHRIEYKEQDCYQEITEQIEVLNRDRQELRNISIEIARGLE